MEPETIQDLREERGQTQFEFGAEIYDYDDRNSLEVEVYRLEKGKRSPGAAARRTLQRMLNGEI